MLFHAAPVGGGMFYFLGRARRSKPACQESMQPLLRGGALHRTA